MSHDHCFDRAGDGTSDCAGVVVCEAGMSTIHSVPSRSGLQQNCVDLHCMSILAALGAPSMALVAATLDCYRSKMYFQNPQERFLEFHPIAS